MNCFIIVRILFEVKTDTVVVQVAQKLPVFQVLDAFLFDNMVYQTSFSKEVVVWEQHFAILLGKKYITVILVMITIMLIICFLHLLIARSLITVFIIIIKHFFYHTKVSKKQTFKNFGESLGEEKLNSTMN